MSYIKKYIVLLVLSLTFLFNFSTISNAVEFHDAADNIFAADLILNERANVDGDAFLIGETVNFAGNAKGNIIGIGNTAVNIATTDFKNAFVIAKGDVNIKGDAKAIYAFGNTIKINCNSQCEFLIAKVVNVSGIVSGDLTIIATQIILDPDLIVTGKINIQSPIEPEYPEGLKSEKVTYKKVEEKEVEAKDTLTDILLRISGFLIWLAPTGLITAIIYIKLLGPIKRQGVLLLKKAPLKVFLYGLLMLFCMPFVSFMFMVAIIGLPTALIILMIYLICFLLAVPCFGVALGEYILPKQTDLVSGVIGTIIISIAVAIPYLGLVIYLIALLYTYGMFSVTIFELAKKENRTARRRQNNQKTLVTKIKTKVSKKIEERKSKKTSKNEKENQSK